MKQLFTLSIFLISFSIFSQTKNLLVFHETNGYRHTQAIEAGIPMFQEFASDNGFTVIDSQDSSVFSEPDFSTNYDAVVFLNTSGNDLLTDEEKVGLENFITSGKGFVGIHAATDTYIDGSWDFYNQLVGGIVQTGPNHTSNNYNADMTVLASHEIIDFLGPVGTVWNKNEEYYYWELNGGQLSTDNTVLLEVEQTGSNSYDLARPITWYKEAITYDDNGVSTNLSGIRSFYTALGHFGNNYSDNSNFREMLENATLWALGENTLSIEDRSKPLFKIAPNPVQSQTSIYFENATGAVGIKLYNILGKEVLSKTVQPLQFNGSGYSLDLSSFDAGIYLLKMTTQTAQKSIKLVKI